ncbi:MAG: Holliday junction resolvase RuvX [Flammeovirgaceae bacterium]|jgi:putative Holliday junction resolvase|nr:Holliday junction resolvase RuvX [Flammeovirgaceae bacterium]
MARIMSIDYGVKRTGIAVTDLNQIIATPLDTVATHLCLQFIENYCKKEPVETFVVGMPKTLNNEDSEIAPLVRKFIDLLQKKFPDTKIYTADERFTSSMAKQALLDSGMKKKDRQQKGNIDKVSATLILQSFLETNRNF